MAAPLWPDALPIARYRFTCALDAPLRLPAYAGSMLRGAFGAALRRTACMTGMPTCPPCPLYRTCAYPAMFEAPPRPVDPARRFSQVSNPYVIEPPPHGARDVAVGTPLVFHMVLVGAWALAQLPLVVHAWQRALRHGLGSERVPARLLQVQWQDEDGRLEAVYDTADGQVAEHTAALHFPAHSPPDAARVVLHIDTPLRLQHEGRPLRPSQLDARTLALAAVRRASLMLGLHAGWSPLPDMPALLADAQQTADDRSGLRWHDWTRFSSRQQQEMTLGGVVGRWTLEGPVARLLPWLWLGQWLHIGKNATMGLGHYRLETAV